MLRPRDSHDLRLIQTNLEFSPPASVRWIHDVFGNSIAIASFAKPSAELRIESSLKLESYVVERPAFQLARRREITHSSTLQTIVSTWAGCASANTQIPTIGSDRGLKASSAATPPIH